MTNKIKFYFDFISPYSYLAHKQIRQIELKRKNIFEYKPILLGGLHNKIGITAPAFINQKAKYLIRDCKMVAKKLNIKFKFNPLFPINSLYLMRGLLTISSKKKENYIDSFFNAYWQDGLDLNDKKIIINILKNNKINEKVFLKDVENQKIKNNLKKLTQQAFDKDIFGAPTFVVNKKIFWGQDRLNYALEELVK